MPKAQFVNFKAVKAAITMEQVLDRYDLLPKFKKKDRSLTGPCPIHKGSNPTQFRVCLVKNVWNCFSQCKRGGNVLDFISEMENTSIHGAALKAIEWFDLNPDEMSAKDENTKHESEKPKAENPKPKPKPQPESITLTPVEKTEPNKPLKFRLDKLDREHPYLTEERGLTPETINDFDLGYFTGEKGMMVGRVTIPIHNAKGELVAYAGRWAGEPPEDTEKYKLPPNFNKVLEVFNLHRAVKEPKDVPLVIVEGFFGVINLHQLGHRKAVALMGWFMSAAQESLIREHANGSRIILMLDEDEAGQESREKIAARLSKFAFVKTHVFPKPDMQPDQLSTDDFAAIFGGKP